ncbi:hypothetical protein ACRS8P_27945 [Burkholderia cenocepacia]
MRQQVVEAIVGALLAIAVGLFVVCADFGWFWKLAVFVVVTLGVLRATNILARRAARARAAADHENILRLANAVAAAMLTCATCSPGR